MQPVSSRANGVLVGVRTSRVASPILVLGGANDVLITDADVRATASAYGTQAVFFPNIAHSMMLEPGWQAVADEIDTWLAGQGL